MDPHNKETRGKKEKSELPTKSWSKSCGLITNLQDRKTNYPAQKGQGTGLERKTRLKSWGYQRALKLGCCQGWLPVHTRSSQASRCLHPHSKGWQPENQWQSLCWAQSPSAGWNFRCWGRRQLRYFLTWPPGCWQWATQPWTGKDQFLSKKTGWVQKEGSDAQRYKTHQSTDPSHTHNICTYTYVHMCTHTHTFTSTNTCTHSHTNTHFHIHIHIGKNMHVHTYTYTHAHACTYPQKYTHMNHTHMPTYTFTNTYTHSF